ncbi:DNA-binding protein [Delftia acidovorans]|uniref:MocR-like pyridoxine biosynthesis transcription factor PdxR n=1 Tax=Delftia acidovorans TaxID=80866 RepID=UPI000BC324CE|nr:PLP-dependent aminotransferase family protein [Delftia acidovorans]ATH11395.1 DNA-binding protein [Delftia acidovorans]
MAKPSVCADLILQMDWRGLGGDRTHLNRGLYLAIRQAIDSGALLPRSRLPASRDLARELGVSRNTVNHAYEQLQVEGYVRSQVGRGTHVVDTLPAALLLSGGRAPARRATAAAPAPGGGLSAQAQALLKTAQASEQQWGAFMPGVPDVTEFPRATYARIHNRLLRHAGPQLLTYGTRGGVDALKQALAEHLRVARSVDCGPGQVLITEGVHQAIDLVVRSLADPGDCVWMEEPGYWGIANVLRMQHGLHLHSVPVDEEGMQLPEGLPSPRLIFVTPSHQYPLGAVMSMARRRALIAYARRVGAWIVEDDYDSEFRFSGSPVPSMQGMEEGAPVIYIGTFSKTLYPGLRMGYMVLPPALAEPLRRIHSELYREGHQLPQQVIAELITEGHYAAHIRKMRLLYGKRRRMLLSLIERYLGADHLPWVESSAGLHFVMQLPGQDDDVALAEDLRQVGIFVKPLSRYYAGPHKRRGLLLGYACVCEEEIGAAFFRMLAVLAARHGRG